MERINKELHVYSGIVEELNQIMMNWCNSARTVCFLSSRNFTFKGFNVYNHIHCEYARASGGSSILLKSSLPQREIKLKANSQAQAVSVSDLLRNPGLFFFSRRGSIIVEF